MRFVPDLGIVRNGKRWLKEASESNCMPVFSIIIDTTPTENTSRFTIDIFHFQGILLAMFHIFPALIALYVVSRFVPSLPVAVAWKWLIAFIILLVSQYHLANRFFFGGMASPETPFMVIVVGGWLFGAFILLACFLLAKDFISLFLWLASKTGLIASGLTLGYRWILGFGMAALLFSAIGVWQAIRVPDVRRIDITLDRLPAGLDGLKLVQLTDLHASRLFQAPWIRAVVDRTNTLNPDLIVITGDLVDGSTTDRAPDVAPLADLKAKLGVFAVTGNHEYYSNYVNWMKAFRKLGLNILGNEHVLIADRNHSLILAGVTDRVATNFGLPEPDIEKALSGIPENLPVILMAHQPKGSAAYADAGVDLQLSGHTHGGQILGIHWITQIANDGYVSGLYRIGNMRLYVSNGTGLWNGFPIRLGKPSEITEIVLHAAGHE